MLAVNDEVAEMVAGHGREGHDGCPLCHRCPFCGAEPERWCVTRLGNYLSFRLKVHYARMVAANS